MQTQCVFLLLFCMRHSLYHCKLITLTLIRIRHAVVHPWRRYTINIRIRYHPSVIQVLSGSSRYQARPHFLTCSDYSTDEKVSAPVDQTSTSSWITLNENKPSTSMAHVAGVAGRSKLRSVVRSCIHAQETGWQSDVRSRIMPGLPTHLVQELNVCTVIG